MVPAGKREAVVAALDDEDIDYTITDETSGREYVAVVSFPLPTSAVEPVLEKLREAGIEENAYTVVLSAETVISRRFDQLTERYAEETDDSDRIAREEIAATARDLILQWRTYAVMTAVSAIVATAGLLLDSPAVVVGSMVIAPLVGPAMATSVGSVLDDRDLFLEGVRYQVVGGVLSVLAATALAVLLRQTHAVPLTASEVLAIGEVKERLAPDVLSLAIALGAGVAGALAISSGASTALVGVMMAVALIPPAAVIGIGIAWGAPMAVLGSTVLVLVNFFSINVTAMGVLWYQGYRPDTWLEVGEARFSTLRRIGVLAAVILLLSVFLGGVTYSTYLTNTFDENAREEVRTLVNEHPTISLLSMEVSYGSATAFNSPQRVVVTLGHPPETDPPLVAEELASRIDGDAATLFDFGDSEVVVEVRYIPVQTESAS